MNRALIAALACALVAGCYKSPSVGAVSAEADGANFLHLAAKTDSCLLWRYEKGDQTVYVVESYAGTNTRLCAVAALRTGTPQ